MAEPVDSTPPISEMSNDVKPGKIGIRPDGTLGLITETISPERADLENKIAQQLRSLVTRSYGEVSGRIHQVKDTSREQLVSEGQFLQEERKGLTEKQNDLFAQIQESSIDEVVFQQKASDIVDYLSQLQTRIQLRTISYPEVVGLIQKCRESQNDPNGFIRSYDNLFRSIDLTNLDAHLADYDRIPGFTDEEQADTEVATEMLGGLIADYFSKYPDASMIQLIDEPFPVEDGKRIRWGITATKDGIKFIILDTSVMRMHESNVKGIDSLYPVNILASTYQTVLEEKLNLQKKE